MESLRYCPGESFPSHLQQVRGACRVSLRRPSRQRKMFKRLWSASPPSPESCLVNEGKFKIGRASPRYTRPSQRRTSLPADNTTPKARNGTVAACCRSHLSVALHRLRRTSSDGSWSVWGSERGATRTLRGPNWARSGEPPQPPPPTAVGHCAVAAWSGHSMGTRCMDAQCGRRHSEATRQD